MSHTILTVPPRYLVALLDLKIARKRRGNPRSTGIFDRFILIIYIANEGDINNIHRWSRLARNSCEVPTSHFTAREFTSRLPKEASRKERKMKPKKPTGQFLKTAFSSRARKKFF